ncbi:hypothetical protein BD410DRAFT_803755 [Rickenella mellea]|uniref:Uncharacterized protein n=1 Tax=Rickenella mellea TaxID=50990 RepID=A0A4Y7Q524_9AGAM|nr:hypothetical protein BD410DRAFT_803755 [Rickenella mellea]
MNPTRIPNRHSRTISSLSIDPSGVFVATGSTDGSVSVWSFLSKKIVYQETFASAITSIAWLISATAVSLVCGEKDGSIVVASPIGLLTVEQDGHVTGFTAFRSHISPVVGLLGQRESFVSASSDELSVWFSADGIVCEQHSLYDTSTIAGGASVYEIAKSDSPDGLVICFFVDDTIAGFSLLTQSVIWRMTSSTKCRTYIPDSIIVCTPHQPELAMTGVDCPRIRLIAAGATHLSVIQQSTSHFLIRTFNGDIIVWDAVRGDVLFYLDIRDFGKDVRDDILTAHYDEETHTLRIIACPIHSTKCVAWDLHRCSRRIPPTPSFTVLRDIKAGKPFVPERSSKQHLRMGAAKANRKASASAALAVSVAVRRSTRRRRIPARFTSTTLTQNSSQ